MGISYFNCDTCGAEMNDCYCDLVWWTCDGCDSTYCDDCVTGKWFTYKRDGTNYCERCKTSGNAPRTSFVCYACKEGSGTHTPGCSARPVRIAPPAKPTRRKVRQPRTPKA